MLGKRVQAGSFAKILPCQDLASVRVSASRGIAMWGAGG